MFFLHGALGSATQFNPLLQHLSGIAHHFPGHGPNPIDAPYSMAGFAKSVLEAMDEQGIQQTEIFGYSMGGYVALYLAAHHPERVSRVITLGTKLDWSPDVAAGMNRMFDPEKIAAKVPQFAEKLAAEHADWQGVCRATATFLDVLGHGGGLSDTEFSSIQCPVTIGWGDQDNVVTEVESRRVAGLIPKGEMVVLPGVKHPLEQVATEALVQYVEQYRNH